MESTIHINANGNINGLTKNQIESLIVVLRTQSYGYNYVKKQSFSDQKQTLCQLQPELKKLSNSEFRKEAERQLQQGKDCEDLLIELEKWKKEQDEAMVAELAENK